MTSKRRVHRRALPLAGGLIIVAVLALPQLDGLDRARANDEPTTAGTITVTITDGRTSTPAPTPAVVPAGAPGGAAAGSGSSSGSGSSAPSSPAATVPPVPAADELPIGGILYVGGLKGSFTPSANPLRGTVDLSFTVRNASKTAFASDAEFWIENPLGTRLDSARVHIPSLEPGETRAVTTTVSGVGQWTIINAHVALTPPSDVDGTKLTSITRDTTVFALPWANALVLAIAIGAAAILRLRRGRSPAISTPEPRGALA